MRKGDNRLTKARFNKTNTGPYPEAETKGFDAHCFRARWHFLSVLRLANSTAEGKGNPGERAEA